MTTTTMPRVTNQQVAAEVLRVMTGYAERIGKTLKETAEVHLCGYIVTEAYRDLRDPAEGLPLQVNPLPDHRIEKIEALVEAALAD